MGDPSCGLREHGIHGHEDRCLRRTRGMRGEEMVISTPDSKVTIIVVPTDEEFMIAADTLEILDKK